MSMRSHYLVAFAGMFAALCGCAHRATETTAAATSASPGTVRIVAIERVYGDLAQQLGGNDARVTTILNSPTADPHTYEPTPRDADAIAGADIVIENGLGYDAFADKLLAASPHAGRVVIVVGSLAGHRIGDNPHVWYETESLLRFDDALATQLARRLPETRTGIERERAAIAAWLARLNARLRALGTQHAGRSVAITEPVFDYILHAAHIAIATPASFSHAIEEGNDPAPQDVDAMHALLRERRVAAFVYNSQTVEPSTTRLLDVAKAANVTVVPVTETLPANEKTQAWIDREVTSLARAL